MTPDDLFDLLVLPHDDLDPATSRLFMAILTLLLARAIDDPAIIAQAVAEARRCVTASGPVSALTTASPGPLSESGDAILTRPDAERP